MEKNIQKNWQFRLAIKSFLALSISLMMTSCVMQTGAYTETDGVYYNPDTDTLPEGYVTNNGNQVGDYYDYQDQSIIDKSNENKNLMENRYNAWNSNENTDSDWGNFAGTEVYYSPNYNYMYGNFYTMGLGSYYGLNNWYWYYYNRFGGFYNPYYGYYNPYYGYFNPYYGGYYRGYNNYYGGYYGYNYNPYQNKRSGENGGGLNKIRKSNNRQINNTGNTGFRNTRNANQNPVRTRNNTLSNPNQNSGNRYRNNESSTPNRTRQQAPPRQREAIQPPRTMNNDYRRESSNNSYRPSAPSNGGGFRSGSSSSSSSSSGGSSSRSGGGFRR